MPRNIYLYFIRYTQLKSMIQNTCETMFSSMHISQGINDLNKCYTEIKKTVLFTLNKNRAKQK